MINKVIIHYLAYPILTNKNSSSEINHQLRKMEAPHNQILRNQTTPNKNNQRNKNSNLENLKKFLNSKKTTSLTLRNIEWRIVQAETNEVNQVLTYISTNDITELNEQIYAGVKLICEKIGWDPLK